MPELKVPEYIQPSHGKQEYCLSFGDEHYDAEFEILGLHGEILNAYNPEIFENRMYQLLDKTIEFVLKENVSKLNIFSMGDFCDGVLRVGQLMTLRYGVVEGSVRYGNFMCNWLNKLSEYVSINFQMVYGNHTELRMLGQPKGTFEKENMGFVVKDMIKTRLENNQNFKMIENPTGLIFSELCGLNVLGIHGEVKDMEKAIKDFSKVYNTRIDILVGGHIHHMAAKNVGVNSDVVNVPSIIGIDDYSVSLLKSANPGAMLFVIEDGYGIVQQNNFRLN